jgi:competence protein ComEA
MPRKNGAASANHAASAARQRFAARLVLPLDDRGSAVAGSAGPDDAGLGGAHRGHNSTAPLLPLRTLIENSSGSSPAGHACPEPNDSVESDPPGEASAPPRLRWRTPWRVAALLAAPCLLLLLWFAWQAWTAQPTLEPLVRSSSAEGTPGVSTGHGASAGTGADNGAPESQGGPQITVHVAGAVRNPGIFKLSNGARVFDAIAAAGGAEPAAELNNLNLAAVVQDAAKIHVPRTGETVPAPAAGSVGTGGTVGGGGTTGNGSQGSGGSADGKLNLNTATADELDALPKVGPVLAKRIVEWRQQHGPFAAVEDLDAVDGVGPKMMETLLPLVTV